MKFRKIKAISGFTKQQCLNLSLLDEWLKSNPGVRYNTDYWNQHPVYLAHCDGVKFGESLPSTPSREYVERLTGLGYIDNSFASAFIFWHQWPVSAKQLSKRIGIFLDGSMPAISDFSYSDVY